MGQRSHGAVFMPSKYVFPGGAVDPGDHGTAFAARLPSTCAHRLTLMSDADPDALVTAAIRELREETGLAVARSGVSRTVPGAAGLAPDASALRFLFRAITPRGLPRRFDARFFLVPATALHGDPDDMTAASAELSHLRWVALDRARTLDMPFITGVVLAEAARALREGPDPAGVPFFDNSGPVPSFRRLL